MANSKSTLSALVEELRPADVHALKDGATPRYRKRGRISWGQLRHKQALQRIASKEAHPRVVHTHVDKIGAQQALTSKTRKDLPRNAQRTMFEKVVLFS